MSEDLTETEIELATNRILRVAKVDSTIVTLSAILAAELDYLQDARLNNTVDIAVFCGAVLFFYWMYTMGRVGMLGIDG